MSDKNELKKRIKEMQDKAEREKAIKYIYEQEKKEFVKDFEENKKDKAICVRRTRDKIETYYGLPVFEDGKLQGFNMMKKTQLYHDSNSSPVEEIYKDEKTGKQLFLSVDEYLIFSKNIAKQSFSKRAGWVRMEELKERENKIEEFILNDTKLGKLRKKVAHIIDKTLGTNLEKKKLDKSIKKVEKDISDKFFGRSKDR